MNFSILRSYDRRIFYFLPKLLSLNPLRKLERIKNSKVSAQIADKPPVVSVDQEISAAPGISHFSTTY